MVLAPPRCSGNSTLNLQSAKAGAVTPAEWRAGFMPKPYLMAGLISVAELIEALQQLDPTLRLHAIKMDGERLVVETPDNVPAAAIISIADHRAGTAHHAELVRAWNAMPKPERIDVSCVPGYKWAKSAHGWKAHLFAETALAERVARVAAACSAKLQAPLSPRTDEAGRCFECESRAKTLLRNTRS
jgi:hypothetical protein